MHYMQSRGNCKYVWMHYRRWKTSVIIYMHVIRVMVGAFPSISVESEEYCILGAVLGLNG